MTILALHRELVDRAGAELAFLPDKPEETAENTIAALWYKAAGTPLSIEAAQGRPLPDLVPAQVDLLMALYEKRRQGVPIQHICGRQRFVDIEMIAGPQALIPRKETEILGRTALRIAQDLAATRESVRVLDVCTGAGNIACLLAAHVANARVCASDLSGEAVELAAENVRFLGLEQRVELRCGDMFKPFDEATYHAAFDLVTCNPPYISSAKVTVMDRQIADHEPRLAFDGGPFGIKILQVLITEAPRFIRSGGWLVFEVGLGQGPAMRRKVEGRLSPASLDGIADGNGEIRVIAAQMP